MDKETELINILKKYNCTYVVIAQEESINKIHNLFCNNIIFDPIITIETFYVGVYHCANENYAEMEKYYLKAVDEGSVEAMNNLGWYHKNITKNYDEMMKYFKRAIDLGNYNSMSNLGGYYQNITQNYDEMEKYYTLAIEGGIENAMNNLAHHYQYVIKNYDEAEKYYKMSIKKGNLWAMKNFGLYHQNTTKNYDEMEKYYKIAIENDDMVAFNYLTGYYEQKNMHISLLQLYISCYKHNDFINREKIIELFNTISTKVLTSENKKMFLDIITKFEFFETDELCVSLDLLVSSLKETIDIMDLHFTYSVNGLGFDVAKQDFFNRCLNIIQ